VRWRLLGRAITRNFLWKLGSLLLAVLLWFAIVGEPEAVATHSVPILYRNLSNGLLIGQDAIDSVRVELRGPAGRLSATSLSDLAVELNLSQIKEPGERTFTLSDKDLRMPDGVTFMRAIPSQLRLNFTRRKEKDVPVEVRFTALPPAGYRIVQEEIAPERLRIAGPEYRVDAIAVAQTDAIDLTGATSGGTYRVNTFISDPQVWFESTPMVSVKIAVAKSDEQK
jgi:YbbR domain-containing protein